MRTSPIYFITFTKFHNTSEQMLLDNPHWSGKGLPDGRIRKILAKLTIKIMEEFSVQNLFSYNLQFCETYKNLFAHKNVFFYSTHAYKTNANIHMHMPHTQTCVLSWLSHVFAMIGHTVVDLQEKTKRLRVSNWTAAFTLSFLSLGVCCVSMSVCHNEKKVLDKWQARQATPAILQGSTTQR